MFNRQMKEDIQFINHVLRRYERLIGENDKKIIELEERLDVYVKEEKECTGEHCTSKK